MDESGCAKDTPRHFLPNDSFSHDCIEMPFVNNELRNRGCIQLTEQRQEESKEEEAMKENLWLAKTNMRSIIDKIKY